MGGGGGGGCLSTGGGSKKNCRVEGVPPKPPTMGNPDFCAAGT